MSIEQNAALCLASCRQLAVSFNKTCTHFTAMDCFQNINVKHRLG